MAVDPIPVVIYAAKSTADAHGSIPTQLADCRAAIEREGGRVIVGEFSDEAKSGYSGNRGAGLAAAKSSPADELWVQHSDRLARGDGLTADHLAEVYFAMRRRGVRLRSVQDDSNLEDVIRVALIGERNHEDSRRKSEAVKSGKRRQFERGERLGGPVLDGYAVAREVKGATVLTSYAFDAERAPVLRCLFELAHDGMGDLSIAQTLNAEGHRTAAGRPWTRRRVQDTVTNPFYAGRVVLHRGQPEQQVTDGGHPALIDPTVFDAIQAARALRDRAKGTQRNPRGRPPTNYALARLARCGDCGEPMYASTDPYRRKRDGARKRRYVCANVKFSTGLCHAPSLDAEVVDRAVIANLDRYLGDFDAWRASIEAGQSSDRDRLTAELERADADVTEAQRQAAKIEVHYAKLLAAGEQDKADAALSALVNRRGEAERAERRAQAARDALADVPEHAPADAMLDFYNALGEAVRGRIGGSDSMATVNAALRDLFSAFILSTVAYDGEHEADVMILPWLLPDVAARLTHLSDGELTGPEGTELSYGARVLATGDEPIVPPLRPIVSQLANTHE